MIDAPAAPGRSAGVALTAALLGIALVVSTVAAADDAVVPFYPDAGASGYRVGDTGLWLGGWATLEGEVPESGDASLGIGDVGLLTRWDVTPRFSLFSEVDLDDPVTWVEGRGVERGSRVLLLERLYLEWSATPSFTLRVGKFLTPFGIWNVIRRAPLTWTVDRPVATQSAFPEHATGASLLWQTTRSGWSLDAIAYGQAQDELVRGTADTSATAAGGGRFVAAHAIGSAYLAWGASGIAFDSTASHRWLDSYGTDVDLTLWRQHLLGEFAWTREGDSAVPQGWSLYVQDVVPLYGSLYGIFRYEHLEPDHARAVNGELIGLAWPVIPHVILKADYQFADHNGDPRARSALERGFVASVTLFF